MFKTLTGLLTSPPLYTRTEGPFWDDPYISAQMLKAHLDPDFEGASRKHSFMEASAAWISRVAPPSLFPTLLDLGCGPGLYAERFTLKGYQVTGVDFSERSIAYARRSAEKHGLSIDYHNQDYLRLRLGQTFDLAVMIYCDYGALAPDDRRRVMTTAYEHLKPGGKLLLDVFSMVSYHGFRESQTWELCEGNGFWRREPHLLLQHSRRYPDRVTLDQTAVITDSDFAVYYLWNTYFTEENLTREAEDAGFQVCGVYGDVAGAPYTERSPVLALLLEK